MSQTDSLVPTSALDGAVFKNRGWRKWQELVVNGLIPPVSFTLYCLSHRVQNAEFTILIIGCFLITILFVLNETGSFTEITVRSESVSIKRLFRNNVVLPYKAILNVDSKEYWGKFARPSLKFRLTDESERIAVKHALSSYQTEQLLQALFDKGIRVYRL